MARVREDSIPHVVRTAHEQRVEGTWNAVISQVDQVNSTIRLIRLGLVGEVPTRSHFPGQYIDLSIPSIPQIGGFTITSPPSTTRDPTNPYIELAIQRSPNNPPAAYLWRSPTSILQAPVSFRAGGNFIYPPAGYSLEESKTIDRAVFVAGGVGINPIMSMLSAIDGVGAGRAVGGMPRRVSVLYTSRRGRGGDGRPEAVLFEERLRRLADKWRASSEVDYQYTFFETSGERKEREEANVRYRSRRIQHQDLFEALGPEEDRAGTVVYVCGLPAMTDEFVEVLQKQPGLSEKQVCCEKWW